MPTDESAALIMVRDFTTPSIPRGLIPQHSYNPLSLQLPLLAPSPTAQRGVERCFYKVFNFS